METIGHANVEPSYIIKRFLENQHNRNLTRYLEGLHQASVANPCLFPSHAFFPSRLTSLTLSSLAIYTGERMPPSGGAQPLQIKCPKAPENIAIMSLMFLSIRLPSFPPRHSYPFTESSLRDQESYDIALELLHEAQGLRQAQELYSETRTRTSSSLPFFRALFASFPFGIPDLSYATMSTPPCFNLFTLTLFSLAIYTEPKVPLRGDTVLLNKSSLKRVSPFPLI